MWRLPSPEADCLQLLITKRLESINLSGDTGVLSSGTEESIGTAVNLLFTAAQRQSVGLNDFVFSTLHLLDKFFLSFNFQPVKALKLQNCRIPQHFFQDLLPAFPNLSKLDVSWDCYWKLREVYTLSHCTIDDNFLLLVRMHCKNLE